MFIHAVLFEVRPKEVATYRKDSKMWARFTQKARGFRYYNTMKRIGHRNQYASVYEWETKRDHDRFMQKFHDLLVEKSKAKVKVLGYYNLKAIDRLTIRR